MTPNTFRKKIIVLLQEVTSSVGQGELVLLRDLDKLISGSALHDIDTYSGNFHSLYVVLKRVAESLGVRIKVIENSYDFKSLILFNEDFQFIKLDVWLYFHRRGIEYFPTTGIENKCLSQYGFFVLDVPYQLELRIKKDLAFVGSIPKKKRQEIVQQFEQAKEYDLLSSLDSKLCEQVVMAIDSPKEMHKLATAFRRGILKVAIKSIKMPYWSLRYVFSRVNKVLRYSGKLVVLVGPDGAGKSTVQNNIKGVFGENYFSGCCSYYSRPCILPNLSSVFGSKKAKKSQSDDEADNPNRVSSPLSGSVKVVYYSFDFFLFRFSLALKLGLGKLVIFDRYFYDYYFQYYWKDVPYVLKRAAEILVPSPDAVLLLSAKAENIHSRKPELDIETINYQYGLFKSQKHIGYKIIPTDVDENETIKEITKVILEK